MSEEEQPTSQRETFARKLLFKQAQNILKKINAGKIATKREDEIMARYYAEKEKEEMGAMPQTTGPGRPPAGRNIALSMKAAESKTGIPRAKLKIAKAMGADAFLSDGRIDLDLLEEFIDSDKFAEHWKELENSEDNKDWRKEETKWKAKLAQVKYEQAMGSVYDANLVHEVLQTAVSSLVRGFRRVVEHELPAQLDGKSAVEILEISRRAMDARHDDILAATDRLVASLVASAKDVQAEEPDDDDEDLLKDENKTTKKRTAVKKPARAKRKTAAGNSNRRKKT